MALPPFLRRRGAGAPRHRYPLSSREVITVSGQFRCRWNTVPAIQKPTNIMYRPAQIRQLTGSEGMFILRIGTSMPVTFLHGRL
jgi:hypothetical protein